MPDGIQATLEEHALPWPRLGHEGRDGASGSLRETLETASIVGLGEASHGTSEFALVRHRLTSALVRTEGAAGVAFEAGAAEVEPLNDYVVYGTGSAREALESLDDWFWRTEGLQTVLRWLRAVNARRPLKARIPLYGIDVEAPTTTLGAVADFLAAVDPTYLDRIQPRIEPVLSDPVSLTGRVPLDGVLEDAEPLARAIADRITSHRNAYEGRTSPAAVARAEVLCRSVLRTLTWLRAGGAEPGFDVEAMAERDRVMAETARDWASRHDPLVIWAHNGHVKRGTFDVEADWGRAETMGAALADAVGGDYVPVGTDFGHGAVRAVRDGIAPEPVPVAEPHSDSATARFRALSSSACSLALSTVRSEPRLASWLESPRRIRNVGSTVDPGAGPAARTIETRLPVAFDGLVFVEESTPSRPLR